MTLDSEILDRIRENFDSQRVMSLIGATIDRVDAGEVVIRLPFREDLTQQDGFLHAGVVTTIADSACGYAAMTLVPLDTRVLSVEFKVNLLSPAVGEEFVATGRVERSGRSISVCRGEVVALREGESKVVSLMQATMMSING